MSLSAMVDTWKIEGLSPAEKLVCLCLADFVNQDNKCWPSQSLISERCGVSRETTNRVIKSLAKKGLVEIEQRINAKGKQSNIYFLAVSRYVTESHNHVTNNHIPPTPPCDDRSHTHVTTDHIEPSTRLSEPSNKEDLSTKDSPPDAGPDVGECVEIWNSVCVPVGLKKVIRVEGPRRAKFLKRLADDFNGDPDEWRSYCERVVASDFCRGEVSGFQATFDWALEPRNVNKVLEGNFDNRATPLNGGGARASPAKETVLGHAIRTTWEHYQKEFDDEENDSTKTPQSGGLLEQLRDN